MNIGIVTTWFERGAAYVSKAYEQALSKEFSVYIYARGGEVCAKGDPVWDRPNVTFAPDWRSRIYQGDSSMSRTHLFSWIVRNKIKVIIFNEQKDFSIVKDCSKYGVIVGAYIDYYKKNTVSSFKCYDFLLCNTRRHLSVFNWHRNCFFIQWGTDTKLFQPVKNNYLTRKETVFFHSAGYGGINCRKGTDVLIKSFQKVKGPSRLVIHSQVPIAKYGKDIQEIVESDERIEFLQKTVPAPGLYYLGDIYVYPSKLEGIGLSVSEALSCGLPVITTDTAPMNEFVTPGYNGNLIKVTAYIKRSDNYYWPESVIDERDLVCKMQNYIDRHDLIDIQKYNARESAINYFDWSKNSGQLCEYIKKVCVYRKPTKFFSFLTVKFFIQDFLRFSLFKTHKFIKYLFLLSKS